MNLHTNQEGGNPVCYNTVKLARLMSAGGSVRELPGAAKFGHLARVADVRGGHIDVDDEIRKHSREIVAARKMQQGAVHHDVRRSLSSRAGSCRAEGFPWREGPAAENPVHGALR